MERLLVSRLLNKTVKTEWTVETHGSLHIFINPNIPRRHSDFFYWRLNDPNGRYLLSIDISEDGYIEMIEVILYNRKISNVIKQHLSRNINYRKGFVKIDTTRWIVKKEEWKKEQKSCLSSENTYFPENYKFIDNSEVFDLQMDKNNLRIEILKSPITQIIWISEFVAFELNDLNEICGIFLKSFLGQDRKRLIINSGSILDKLKALFSLCHSQHHA